MRISVLLIAILLALENLQAQDIALNNAQQISLKGFDNLYKVSDELYRSEQPNRKEMKELEELGVVTVLNLRKSMNDKGELKGSNLIGKRVAINAWKMSYNDLIDALKVIDKSEKPVLVHCLHGSDRTGAVVAAYRMVYEGWSKEDAISEFLEPQFGFHEKWFPDILVLLQEFDVEQFKKNLQFDD